MPGVALVSLTVLLWAQVVRVLFPLLFQLSERVPETLGTSERAGFVLAGGLAALVFLAPLLAPLLDRPLGARRSLALALAGLVALRLAVQIVHPVPLWMAVAGTVLALVALALELRLLRGPGVGGPVVLGVVLGLSLDVAIRGAFRTWDPTWQEGPAALGLTAALAAALGLAAGRTLARGPADTEAAPPGGLRVLVLGPFLYLQLLFLQSPAFVASSAGISVAAATAVILAADAAALAAAAWAPRRPPGPPGRALGTLALAGLAYALVAAPGAGVAAAVAVAGPLGAALGALALSSPGPPAQRPRAGTSPAFALASLLLVVLAVLYQIHYEVPLPFPNTLIPPAAALLLGLGAVRAAAGPAPERPRAALAAIPLALLLVPAGVALAGPDPVPTRPADLGSLRLVSYNLHAGTTTQGQVDLEAFARVIEREAPDVVVLQEVARGWAISGMTDVAEWLSPRLRMPYVYAPAADRQFGNAVLSRLPVLGAQRVFLPKGAGPQRRSYLRVDLDVGGGRTVTVIATHLQRHDASDTRIRQIETVLAAWGGSPRTLIVGDMNVQPDEADWQAFVRAGLVNAQDATGLGHLHTVPFPEHPRGHGDHADRVDMILGSPDLGFREFRLPRSTVSDHLPLVVTVELR